MPQEAAACADYAVWQNGVITKLRGSAEPRNHEVQMEFGTIAPPLGQDVLDLAWLAGASGLAFAPWRDASRFSDRRQAGRELAPPRPSPSKAISASVCSGGQNALLICFDVLANVEIICAAARMLEEPSCRSISIAPHKRRALSHFMPICRLLAPARWLAYFVCAPSLSGGTETGQRGRSLLSRFTSLSQAPFPPIRTCI